MKTCAGCKKKKLFVKKRKISPFPNDLVIESKEEFCIPCGRAFKKIKL